MSLYSYIAFNIVYFI